MKCIPGRPVARNVVWRGFEEWRRGRGWGLGRGYPPPQSQWGWGLGKGLCPLPQKNFGIFSFEMVHFDAFWKTMEVNCVTTFSGCTCSTFQQKDRPKIFCADFSGGGVSTPKTPLWLRACIRFTSCLVLGWGFLGRRIEWRYFGFDQIKDGFSATDAYKIRLKWYDLYWLQFYDTV